MGVDLVDEFVLGLPDRQTWGVRYSGFRTCMTAGLKYGEPGHGGDLSTRMCSAEGLLECCRCPPVLLLLLPLPLPSTLGWRGHGCGGCSVWRDM